MSIEIRYRCCEHCVDDPSYHEDNAPDSHDVPCTGPGQFSCKRGDEPVRFDTERNAPVAGPNQEVNQ